MTDQLCSSCKKPAHEMCDYCADFISAVISGVPVTKVGKKDISSGEDVGFNLKVMDDYSKTDKETPDFIYR